MKKGIAAVIENTFFTAVSAFGSAGLNLALMLAYAHTLGPELYGLVASAQANVIIWAAIIDLGLNNALIALLQRNHKKLKFIFMVGSIRLVGIFVAIAFIRNFSTANDELTLYFIPFLIGLALQNTATAYALSMGRQKEAALAALLGSFISIAICFTQLYLGTDVKYILFAQSCSGVATTLALAILLITKKPASPPSVPPTEVNSANTWALLVKESFPYAVSFATLTIWQRLDQISVAHFLSPADEGQYAIASRLASIPVLFAAAAAVAIFPDMQRLGRDAPEKIGVSLGAVLKIMTWFGLPVTATILVAVSATLMPFYPKYVKGLSMLVLFAPGVLFYWTQMFSMQSLYGCRRHRDTVLAHVYSLSIFIAAVTFLTRTYAIPGTILAFNIFLFALSFFSYRALKTAGILPSSFKIFSALTAQERTFIDEVRSKLKMRVGLGQ